MKKIQCVADLFANPVGWGLRGDPHLWEEMKAATLNTPLPDTEDALMELLLGLFEQLTGEKPESGKLIHVARFSQSGMSDGMVSADFWLNRIFPALVERYRMQQ